MNPASLARTLVGVRESSVGVLRGYRRVCNMPVNGFSYLNLELNSEAQVSGILIAVSEEELEMLRRRERGYECIDVTESVDSSVSGIIYTFAALMLQECGLPTPRSYLATCLVGVLEEDRDVWLNETHLPSGILEDLDSPVYENVALA